MLIPVDIVFIENKNNSPWTNRYVVPATGSDPWLLDDWSGRMQVSPENADSGGTLKGE